MFLNKNIVFVSTAVIWFFNMLSAKRTKSTPSFLIVIIIIIIIIIIINGIV